MRLNKEVINPFTGVTNKRLRELWDRADETLGEVVGDLTKGEISLEITRRIGGNSRR